jgi:hypothetical protein
MREFHTNVRSYWPQFVGSVSSGILAKAIPVPVLLTTRIVLIGGFTQNSGRKCPLVVGKYNRKSQKLDYKFASDVIGEDGEGNVIKPFDKALRLLWEISTKEESSLLLHVGLVRPIRNSRI